MCLTLFLLCQPEEHCLFAPAASIDPEFDRTWKGALLDKFINHGSTKTDDLFDLLKAKEAIGDCNE